MKQNRTKLYAKALADLMLDGEIDDKKIVVNFLKLLEKNGDMKKAKEIIALAEDLFIKRTGRRRIVLDTARRVDIKDILKNILDAGDVVEEKIDKNLIAGIKIIINDRQLDLSLQKKLNTIFK